MRPLPSCTSPPAPRRVVGVILPYDLGPACANRANGSWMTAPAEGVAQRAGALAVRQALTDQLLVGGLPDRARPARATAPLGRAGGAPALLLLAVADEQQPPALRQAGDLGARQGKQRARVPTARRVVGQVG